MLPLAIPATVSGARHSVNSSVEQFGAVQPGSGARTRLGLISHLHEHRFDVRQPQLTRVVLLERVKLHRGDPVGLDRVVTAGEERLHVVDEGARDFGREFDGHSGHGARYRLLLGDY